MIKYYNKELILPYFILFIVLLLSIYPLLYMVSTSLMTAGEASNQYLFPKKLMFENYYEVWTSNRFQRYTFNSLIISSIILFQFIPFLINKEFIKDFIQTLKKKCNFCNSFFHY